MVIQGVEEFLHDLYFRKFLFFGGMIKLITVINTTTPKILSLFVIICHTEYSVPIIFDFGRPFHSFESQWLTLIHQLNALSSLLRDNTPTFPA